MQLPSSLMRTLCASLRALKSVHQTQPRRHFGPFALAAILGMTSALSGAEPTLPLSALKKLSFEELMDLEVISVSRRIEKLSDAASAIQVVTSDEIRRSGATSLPEALRLA